MVLHNPISHSFMMTAVVYYGNTYEPVRAAVEFACTLKSILPPEKVVTTYTGWALETTLSTPDAV